MAIKPFQFLSNLKQLCNDRFAIAGFLQLRLVFNGLRQCHRIGRIVWHHLAQSVDLTVRHLQNAPDIAQYCSRLQLAVCDDLGDTVFAVFFLNVPDRFVAPLLTKIDVEVRHRHTFWVQKPLKQQTKTQWIEVCNRQHPGHQRSRTRPPPWPDGNALRLRPFNKVGNDQEVAWKLHAGDNAKLVFKPLVVVLACKAIGDRVLAEAHI